MRTGKGRPDLNALAALVATDLRATTESFRYAWKISDRSWGLLGLGFDHLAYNNESQRNVAMRDHVSKVWPSLSYDEKARVGTWIIKEWGGIKRNSPQTVRRYVDACASVTSAEVPYIGISSFSKILAFAGPLDYAIYDARVAASINAIQLSGAPSNDLSIFFSIPPSQNKIIAAFRSDTSRVPRSLSVPRENTYEAYLALLRLVAAKLDRSILEVEMALFAGAEAYCNRATARFAP